MTFDRQHACVANGSIGVMATFGLVKLFRLSSFFTLENLMRLSLTACLICSIASLGILASGCGGPDTASKPSVVTPKAGHGHDEHDHPSEGPHHGHLIELGNEEYHAELTHDESTHTVTVYLLDSAAKKSVSIPDEAIGINLILDGKPVQFKLTAVPQTGDPAGSASSFALADESLHEALEQSTTKGRLNVMINGKGYIGQIEHHAHDDDSHAKKGHAK